MGDSRSEFRPRGRLGTWLIVPAACVPDAGEATRLEAGPEPEKRHHVAAWLGIRLARRHSMDGACGGGEWERGEKALVPETNGSLLRAMGLFISLIDWDAAQSPGLGRKAAGNRASSFRDASFGERSARL